MMLYTIGHAANYRAARETATGGEVWKVAGGYAFLTLEDAQRRIAEEDKIGVWTVFGIQATPEDIEQAGDGWWFYLKRDALLVFLDDM